MKKLIDMQEFATPNNEGRVMVCVSPMSDGVTSVIYLFEKPDKTLLIGYDELKGE